MSSICLLFEHKHLSKEIMQITSLSDEVMFASVILPNNIPVTCRTLDTFEPTDSCQSMVIVFNNLIQVSVTFA